MRQNSSLRDGFLPPKHLSYRTYYHCFSSYFTFYYEHRFDAVVTRYRGDHRVRHLNCRSQFIAMLYAQLAGSHSLRYLESTFNSHGNHHYYLGVIGIRRSTLADANQKRPLAIYKDLFFFLLSQLSTLQLSLQELTRLIAANLFQGKTIAKLIASAQEMRKPNKSTFVMLLEIQFG